MNTLIRQMARSLRVMIGRGVLRLVNEAQGLQQVQVELLKGELLTLDRFQDYGFSSHPLPGAEAITVAVGGRRGKSVVLAMDDRRYRVQLNAGDVALYTHDGTLVALRTGGIVEIVAATKVTSQTPIWEHTGAFKVTGDLELVGAFEQTGDMAITGTVSATGSMTSSTSLGAPIIAAATSLTVNGLEMLDHEHYYTWGTFSGNGYTQGPGAPQP